MKLVHLLEGYRTKTREQLEKRLKSLQARRDHVAKSGSKKDLKHIDDQIEQVKLDLDDYDLEDKMEGK